MLAGRMKLKHFALIAFAGATALGAGGAFWFSSLEPEPDDAPAVDVAAKVAPAPKPVAARAPAATPAPKPAPAAAPASKPAPTAASGPAWQGRLLAYAGRDLGTKKKKDAVPGAVKVNIYQDAGEATVNRAKVDLDRDDQWDEKWTFDGTSVSKKVSPGDDEDYSQAFEWDGSAWVPR